MLMLTGDVEPSDSAQEHQDTFNTVCSNGPKQLGTVPMVQQGLRNQVTLEINEKVLESSAVKTQNLCYTTHQLF